MKSSSIFIYGGPNKTWVGSFNHQLIPTYLLDQEVQVTIDNFQQNVGCDKWSSK